MPDSLEDPLPDDTPRGERRRGPQTSAEVILVQLGGMQSALDRMDRTIERGFDRIDGRLDDFDKRLAVIERRQEYDAARLKSLEEFRNEQDRREEQRKQVQEAELKAAVDQSNNAKVTRQIVAIGVGLLATAGTIVSIIAATGGFS